MPARGPRPVWGSRAAVAAVMLGAAAACTPLGVDLDQIVAIEVRFPDSAVVEEGDTIFPWARAIDGRGDSVAANVFWAALDTAQVTVLDSTTGVTLGKKAGSGRLQARVGSLRSNPVPVVVRAQADTVFAAGALRDTVVAGTSVDSLSDSLTVQMQDRHSGSTPAGLAGRPVIFTITYPIGGAGFTLVPQDTVLTGSAGVAAVRVRLINRQLPDSVVVTATATRANGQPIPGSPITFVVEFTP